jgi:ABC-type dipeptide/oligopeptide/nickel transport system ATPase component
MKQFNRTLSTIEEAMLNIPPGKHVKNFDINKHSGPVNPLVDSPTTVDDDDNLPAFSYKAVERQIIRSIASGKPLLIYGESGVGKSVLVKSVAKSVAQHYYAQDKGMDFVDWEDISNAQKIELLENPDKMANTFVFMVMYASRLEPIDLRGLEIPMSNKPYMDPKIPLWIWYMVQPASKGMFFLDELNQSKEDTFNSLFGVILDKKAAEMPFSTYWSIIAAGNLGTQHSTVNQLPYALTQRFDTVYLVASPKYWSEWALSPNEYGETMVDRDIVTFALSDPASTFLVEQVAGKSNSAPNPRNLVAASDRKRELQYFYTYPDEVAHWYKKSLTGNFLEDLKEALAATCGREWVQGFIQFIEVYSKLNWDELAKDPKKFATKEGEKNWAYMQYILQTVLNTFGSDTDAHKQMRDIFEQEKVRTAQGQNMVDPVPWKPFLQFTKDFVKVCTYLIYQVKDTGSTRAPKQSGQQNRIEQEIEKHTDGEGEYLATLFAMLNSTDKQSLMNLLAVMKRFPNEEGFPLMRGIIKEVGGFKDF